MVIDNFPAISENGWEQEGMPMLTAVATCRDYERKRVEDALRKVLSACHGLDTIRPGMRVGIKMNLVSAMRPDQAATVHPEVLGALCRMLRELGAEPVIGDSPGGTFLPANLSVAYRVSGVQACERDGAVLNMDCSVEDVEFPSGTVMKHFKATGWLSRCDAIINVCKLKTHGMVGMSAAVKNLFGTIPGTVKPEYHYRFPNQRDFGNMLVDLNEYWKPVVSIADAVICMEGNGPTKGQPRQVGCLAASCSPYALDLVLADLIGLTADDVPTLRIAHERGLAPLTAKEVPVETDAPLDALRVADFVHSGAESDLRFVSKGRLFSKAVGTVLASKPALKKDACVGCGKCAGICPAGAITMENGRPVIHRKRCIRCFCCQEFCPVGAMRVKRTAIARLLVH